jgi:hypothetical protein
MSSLVIVVIKYSVSVGARQLILTIVT